MKIILLLVSYIIALICFIKMNRLTIEILEFGSTIPMDSSTIYFNNKGSIRYITEEQNIKLIKHRGYLFISIFICIVAHLIFQWKFIVDLIKGNKEKI